MAQARQGIGAVRKYFQEMVMTAQMKFHGARVMLLGHAEVGKTCLARGLAQIERLQPHGYVPSDHIGMSSIALGEGMMQMALSVWDLPGRAECAAMLQPFFADGSLYALVLPALDV